MIAGILPAKMRPRTNIFHAKKAKSHNSFALPLCTGLSHADSEDLANMFSKYRETVIQNFMELFTSYATALTKYDDKLIFYRVRNNYAFIVLIINYVH